MFSNQLSFPVGGAVSSDSPYYINRSSDDELLNLLRRGEYCYVLCSRQMGKTSLIVRTKEKLDQENIATVYLALDGEIGTCVDAKGWYQALLRGISKQLKLQINIRGWWETCDANAPNEYLLRFFEEEMTPKIQIPAVIFLDEIDVTKELSFIDDFFRAIRTLYNNRAFKPEYRRITFCLIGAATLNELIKSLASTSWNIGKTIELQDFDIDRHSLAPLERGLSEDTAMGKAILRAILYWTGGQPFLTCRVCEEFVKHQKSSPDDVGAIISQIFTGFEGVRNDTHFASMMKFLISDRVEHRLSTLKLYRSIWSGEEILDQESPTHDALKLSGIVKRNENGLLVVRNRIYQQIFTDEWAARTAEVDTKLREEAASLRATAEENEALLLKVLDDYLLALSAYQHLLKNPVYEGNANELLAGFFERRGEMAKQLKRPCQSLLWQLKALETSLSKEREKAVLGTLGTQLAQQSLVVRCPNPNATRLNVGVLSPNGKFLLTGGDDGVARLWAGETGRLLMRFAQHKKRIGAVALSLDGEIALIGSDDSTASLWRVSTGERIGGSLKHQGWVRSVSFSPDGQTVLTGSDDGTARLWLTDSGKPIGQPMHHQGLVNLVAFSPNGRYVLTSSTTGTARLWSPDSGEPIGRSLEHGWLVWAVAFSPDGQTLLTGSDGGKAQLWHLESQRPIGQPMRHSEWVSSVAFSPDGQFVLTGSADGFVRLWEARSGNQVGRPIQHSDEVVAVDFSPDGRSIISATQSWLYKANFDGTTVRPTASCFLPSHWVAGGKFHFLDSDARRVRVLAGTTADLVHLVKVDFDNSNLEVFQGDPSAWLREWQQKLGLQINETGEIVLLKTSKPTPKHKRTDTETEKPVIGTVGLADVSQNQRLTMIYASTFLSHSSTDQQLVQAVARELGQRGILAWLDVNELRAGLSLTSALAEAVQRQATLTVFLSLAAVKSGWVERELKAAFEMEKELGVKGRILPVFLDDPEIVVRAHDLLRERWLDESRRHVDMLGIVSAVSGDDRNRAKEIAGKIARSIYRALELEKKDEVIIYLDQRGEGLRRGEPPIPPELQNANAPVLVFRPDLGMRTWSETLTGDAWEEFRDNIKNSLGEALGPLRVHKRKIHLAGLAQLGLAYLIGKYFARNTETELHCVGKNEAFTCSNLPGTSAISGGHPHCETKHAKVPPLPEQGDLDAVSLLLCKVNEHVTRFVDYPLRHISATPDAPRPILVKHDDLLTNSVQVMIYIANVVALLQRLQSERGTRTIKLYTSLPFHAIPLLASNLHPYVVDSVRFMEYRSDLSEQSPTAIETYSQLSF